MSRRALVVLRHPAAAAYAAANLALAAEHLHAALAAAAADHSDATAAAADADAASRAALHLLTAVLIAPAALQPAPGGAPARRAPVLATFLVALVLLIDATLRLLPALHAALHGAAYPAAAPSVSSAGADDAGARAVVRFVATAVLHAAFLLVSPASSAQQQQSQSQSQQLQHALSQSQQQQRAARARRRLPAYDADALDYDDPYVAKAAHKLSSAPSAARTQRALGAEAARAAGAHGCAALRLYAGARLAAVASDGAAAWGVFPASLTALLTAVVALATTRAAGAALARAARVLMQAAPSAVVAAIRDARAAVLALDGVLDCGHVHIWEEAAGVIVGTLSVTVEARASKSDTLRAAAAAFDGLVDDLTVQVESWRAGAPT